MSTQSIARRQFLAGAGAAAFFSRFSLLNALAQSAPAAQPGYKALVCIFLHGGNDGHNTIVPTSQAAFNLYKAARGALAMPTNDSTLLPIINSDGNPYGLHSGLAAIHPLWAQGKLAVLANVGTLVQPVTRSQYLSNARPVPTNLFSHSDQVQQIQSGIPSSSGGTGWGGRTADILQPLNGAATFPTTCSIAGPALFCTGNAIQSAALLPGFNLDASGMQLWPQAAADARKAGLQQVLQLNSGLALVQAANQTRKEAMSLNAMLTGANASITTPFPGTSLGMQLKQVASIISLRASTGMNRQIFFCSLGGFDTHSGQSWQQFDLLREVSQALLAFYQSTIDLGVSDKVTSFTLSDFGRTLQASGSGCDHGWGNHHLIMGDAVKGGSIYGTFPNLALGGPDDSGSRGALIPTTSMDQFAATLATWLGVPPANLPSVLGNIGNFGSSNLGFLS
ncbi:MAG: hypothetical protein JWL59_1992 [Chthoniobacteraceae bacterium]|nr:hypothetical protein [Chthoniobacteraceae bacterium]